MNKANRNWIKKTLPKFPFVKWDRFIPYKEDGFIEVFGWIDRKDGKRDFIVLEFALFTNEVNCIATSSAKYSKKISKILGEEHIKCINLKTL